jgi:hypothetical protein
MENGEADSPTPTPTSGMFLSRELDIMMLVAESASILLRTIIGLICLRRLIEYRQRGLLRCGEIKSVFHVSMLATLFFSLPYFIYCGFNFYSSDVLFMH